MFNQEFNWSNTRRRYEEEFGYTDKRFPQIYYFEYSHARELMDLAYKNGIITTGIEVYKIKGENKFELFGSEAIWSSDYIPSSNLDSFVKKTYEKALSFLGERHRWNAEEKVVFLLVFHSV